MRKYADKYLVSDPWSITEQGLDQDKTRVSESLFALSNEHMGIRGYFEEGYSGDTLVGSYINGVYEERKTEGSSYKGISNRLCFMVNTVDWLHLRIAVGGEALDLAKVSFDTFSRTLDFRSGLLTRSFVWTTRDGKKIEVRFERFLSMDREQLGYQRLSIVPQNFSGVVQISSGLDFSLQHEQYKRNYWECVSRHERSDGVGILCTTVTTRHRVYAAFRQRVMSGGSEISARDSALQYREADLFAGYSGLFSVVKGETLYLEKVAIVNAPRERNIDNAALIGESESILESAPDFDTAYDANRLYWKKIWAIADIEIDGDPENQQGIRFSIFQLEQTFRGRTPGANIGAKGLTGEFYNGNAFWDTEVYCLPYYLLKNHETARALIDYRYRTLSQAIDRARELDCEGACYPVATIDGTESCTLWQHASLQFQPTTAVAYAIQHYANVTGDISFLLHEGLEMLIQISRFLVSRAQWSVRKQAYGFYCVMGPDEFQMMVHNNAYTNYMAKRSLEFAVETLENARTADPSGTGELLARVGFHSEEAEQWKRVANLMFVPKDVSSPLFEQHEGFFDLPHVDIDSIPPEQFPLYHSWSYDRIYRNDMIKQPDVLMFLFLYNQSFTLEEKLVNYDYYEPRCIHESSLSPSVHSILAAELGKTKEAYDFFGFATRIDLDNYNRNTREGLHLTSIAGAWMNIVYGFGGFRSDGPVPVLNPTIPEAWSSYSFRLKYRSSVVQVRVSADTVAVSLVEGPPLKFRIGGTEQEIGASGLVLQTVGARV